MTRLVKFIRLPYQEKKVFFQSLYYLIFFRIRLITTSPKKLFSSVSKESVCFKQQSLPVPSSHRIVRIVNTAGNIVPYSTCLSKALAGYVLLARYGHQAKLHIGVSKDKEQKLEAHAWLSLHDDIILGMIPELERFQELPLDLIKDLP